ncbi:DMT family transporter [Megasphaera coli]|uniref:DMT family transporter n=1 Tax=Colibacter massiliensis TaxID=1852379 RepID=UPI00094EFAD0|nr:DMT family transporter [Colibacter massiliensis]
MNKRNAEILLIAVIILRSTSYLFSKIGLATLPPLEILAIRFFLSFLILGLIFYNHLHRTVTKPLLRSAANLGAILFACMACELISLTTIDSSMASFLENTAVAWVPLILAVKNRALPNKSTSICTLVIVCGIGLLTLNTTEFHLSSGELICLCGSVCYAFWIIKTTKEARRFDPLSLGITQFFFLTLYSTAGTFLFEIPFIPTKPVEWEVILALTFICTILGFTLQPVAQRYTTSEKAGLFTAVNPLFAAILGFVILDERFSFPQIIGGTLILFSIALIQAAGSRNVFRH